MSLDKNFLVFLLIILICSITPASASLMGDMNGCLPRTGGSDDVQLKTVNNDGSCVVRCAFVE